MVKVFTNDSIITPDDANRWEATSEDVATTVKKGLMSHTDKSKLDSMEQNANNYTHPSTHPASIIVQDTNNRFVSDNEKNIWNSKATTDLATISKSGLMSSGDKSKLDTVESGAQVNAQLATKSEAELGLDTTKTMTAARTKDAIEKLTPLPPNASNVINGLMSKEDKLKLDSVATGANNYTHPATHPASVIVQDANNRFVSDAEKVTWNAKSNLALGVTAATAFRGDQGKVAYDHSQVAHAPADAQKNPPVASSMADGLMSKEDRSKLDSIAPNANNYVHPSSHPASMITQDANNRFMTDAERSKLAGVATGANNYTHPATHPASIIVQDADNRFMTDAERSKLAGVATGANNYVHPSTHPASMITQDINNRFATDAEKTKWNTSYEHSQVPHAPADAQKNPGNATSTTSGLMSNTDKSKLDGVEAGANKYLHPSTHPASMIVQDANNRFMTDIERNKLAGIANGANNYTHPATHPPSIIAQNTTNRFVTDAEKTLWNGKASTSVVTTASNGLMSASDKNKLEAINTRTQNFVIDEAGNLFVNSNQVVFFTEFEEW